MMFTFASPILHVLWLCWAIQALFAVRNVYMFLRREKRYAKRDTATPYTPPAVVIVPVKGNHDLLAHLRGLLEQDYPQYRLIFAVESMDDPAYRAIRDFCSTRMEFARILAMGRPSGNRISPGLVNVTLVSAGLAQNQAQKLHNQLAALGTLTSHDEVVVFADADAVMSSHWLRQLVEPLGKPGIGLTTAWRWLVPMRGGMASSFTSIINSSIVTLMGRDHRTRAWGGSMATRREVLKTIGMPKPWTGVFNDDVTLSNAVRDAGLRVYLVPNLLVASDADYTWASAFEFGRRQYLHGRYYVGLQWLWAPVGTTLYLAGFLSALIKTLSFTPGWGWALGTLVLVMGLDSVRAIIRETVARQVFSEPVLARLDRLWWWERLGTPMWMAYHWVICCSAMVGRRFTWGQVTYEALSRTDVKVVRRGS